MSEKKRLTRESTPARPRSGTLIRGESADSGYARDDVRNHEEEDRGTLRRGGRRGRPALRSEFNDINRGLAFVGAESIAIAMDMFSRVLRGSIDRAFDEDYAEPGDIVRGVAGEADLAVYDLVAELRHVPRRLSHRFDSAVRSPRADQGERHRRAEAATTPADSPASRAAPRPPAATPPGGRERS